MFFIAFALVWFFLSSPLQFDQIYLYHMRKKTERYTFSDSVLKLKHATQNIQNIFYPKLLFF